MSKFFNEYGVPISPLLKDYEDKARELARELIDQLSGQGITLVEIQAIERHAIMTVQGMFVERLLTIQGEMWNKKQQGDLS